MRRKKTIDDEKLLVDRKILQTGIVNFSTNNECDIDATNETFYPPVTSSYPSINAVTKPSNLKNGQTINLVNLAGLFQLVFVSRKPEAKMLKRWLAHDVLPELYRTGNYSIKAGV